MLISSLQIEEQLQPNGPALSCRVTNFNFTQNELSYKTNIFFQHKTSKRNVKLLPRSYGQLERLVSVHL
jgi:hypothetical protein